MSRCDMGGAESGGIPGRSLRGQRSCPQHVTSLGGHREWAEGSISQMEFQDKVLKCIDCGADFIFTAGEQLFFHDKQFKNEPKRCKACKTKRVSVLGAAPSGPGNSFAKVETRT